MFESDADRLAMIKSLGGQLVRASTGAFWAIFDNEYVEVTDTGVESRLPALTSCRTSDVERLQLDRGTPIDVDGNSYRLKSHQPDGSGMSLVTLRR